MYSVPSISGYDTCSAGYSLFQHPRASSQHPVAITMYQLTDRGSIYGLDFDFSGRMSNKKPREMVQWSSGVKNMIQRTISQTIGQREWRNKTKVDLSPAYQRKSFPSFSSVVYLMVLQEYSKRKAPLADGSVTRAPNM